MAGVVTSARLAAQDLVHAGPERGVGEAIPLADAPIGAGHSS